MSEQHLIAESYDIFPEADDAIPVLAAILLKYGSLRLSIKDVDVEALNNTVVRLYADKEQEELIFVAEPLD